MNTIEITNDYAKMTLANGKTVLLDKADVKKVARVNWYADFDGRNETRIRGYVTTKDGKRVRRELSVYLGIPATHCVHKNGNTFDFRRDNLDICTRQQIAYMSKTSNESGVKGVNKNKNNKWVATINYNGDNYYLGSFDNKAQAVRARVNAENIYCRNYLNAEQKLLHKVLAD